MKHGMAEGMPFKKMSKKMERVEAAGGTAGGKKSTKARLQGLSLAGRKGASQRGSRGY